MQVVLAVAALNMEALRLENEQLEAEIQSLTAKKLGSTAVTTSNTMPSEVGGIKVLQFDQTGERANEAGVNHGSAWTPASTGRRTILGGFFTS